MILQDVHSLYGFVLVLNLGQRVSWTGTVWLDAFMYGSAPHPRVKFIMPRGASVFLLSRGVLLAPRLFYFSSNRGGSDIGPKTNRRLCAAPLVT